MNKRIIGSLLAGFVAVSAMGQISNTLSPYSQFGLGVLAEQSQGFNKGMSGLAYGMRNGKYVNVQNPASYSSIDSLTMIFDLGVSGQLTNFKEGAKKVNAKTADFDYAVASFRILPKLGASFGVIPYSNIGYDYSQGAWIGEAYGDYYGKSSDNYYVLNYTGSGGLSQAFVGLGWEFVKGLSIGANFSYFWGKYTKTAGAALTDSYANTLTRVYSADINSWKLDLGAQYSAQIGKSDILTIGGVVGIGHSLNADAKLSISQITTTTSVTTTTNDSITDAFKIPYTFGLGFSYSVKKSLTFGVDYMMQKWGDIDYPEINSSTGGYKLTSGLLKDRHKVTVGVDWVPDPNPMSRGFFKHIHYRAGASYATPYYKIGTKDGPKELCVSAGFSVPIINTWNNRTLLNISAQWVRTSAQDLITENTFRINIGLTFNERWFAKWKVD